MAFLSDIWFYAYGAGLVVGIGLFVFLRGKFNAAVAGPDSSDLAAEFEKRMRAAGIEPEPVKVSAEKKDEAGLKVSVPEAAKPVPPAEAARPVSAPPAAAASPAEKKPEPAGLTGKTMIGGVSPAIVYLQNLKMQIEHFEKEIQQLRGDVSGFMQKHDTQYSTLLKRLGDLQGEMHQSGAAPAPRLPAAAKAPAPPQAPRPVAAAPKPAAPASAAGTAREENAPRAAAPAPVIEGLSPVRSQLAQEAPASRPSPAAPVVEVTSPIAIQAPAQASGPKAAVAAAPLADEGMSLRPPDENAGKGKGKAPIWPV